MPCWLVGKNSNLLLMDEHCAQSWLWSLMCTWKRPWNGYTQSHDNTGMQLAPEPHSATIGQPGLRAMCSHDVMEVMARAYRVSRSDHIVFEACGGTYAQS